MEIVLLLVLLCLKLMIIVMLVYVLKIRIMNININGLKDGEIRPLTFEETTKLRSLCGMGERSDG